MSRKFRIVNLPKFHGDKLSTLARPSHDSLAKYFGEKIRIKFLNMFKNFATSSRLVGDTRNFSGMSCESPRQNLQNSREKFASEILALVVEGQKEIRESQPTAVM